MKTSIYVDNGIAQLVITAENRFEKESLKKFKDSPLEVRIVSGSFYECNGGWVRNNLLNSFDQSESESSLILSIKNDGEN